MKKVLFVAYGGGHVNMVIPVAKKLMAQPGFYVEVLGLTTARHVLEKENIPCFGFSDLEVNSKALAIGEKLNNEYGQATSLHQLGRIAQEQ